MKTRYELKKEIKTLKTRVIFLENWKGKDKIKILKTKSDWKIIEHRKNKETEEIKEIIRTIPHKNVLFIKSIINHFPKDQEKIKARDVWLKIIFEENLDIDRNSFNGGHNIAKYYFL